nr:hypothetical protein [Bradyrhizobium rifense]
MCKGGKFGSLRAHVEAGKLSETTLHAELGQIVAGLKPGRQSDDETNLLWHRGLSLSDIALGHAMLEKAERIGAMIKTEWIKKGAFVVPYGTMSAIELSLTDIMSKLVVGHRARRPKVAPLSAADIRE